MLLKGYITNKVKLKNVFIIENNVLLFEQDIHSIETGEIEKKQKQVVAMQTVNAYRDEIQELLDDIDEFIKDAEKEIAKI